MKSKEALEMEQEQLEIEPSLSNLTSLENATKEQMVKLFEQFDKNEEEAGIRAEALRRLKVRQISKSHSESLLNQNGSCSLQAPAPTRFADITEL